MSRLAAIFNDLRALRARAVLPFICGGYPGPGDTARTLLSLQEAGAPVVEVGIPYSDPIADGPVIAAAMHDALGAGATPASVFAEIGAARAKGLTIGVVAMMSVSLAWRIGPERLVRDAKAAGLDGFIFPDLPLHEFDGLTDAVRGSGLDAILLVAPTTPDARAAEIAKACSGFVYLLARAGITGESAEVPTADIARRIGVLRGATQLPIACGFGISTAQQVRSIIEQGGADAAIVGSALVRRMKGAADAKGDPAEEAAAFVRSLI